MNSETRSEQPLPAPEAPVYSVPWKFIDNWIAVVLHFLVNALGFCATYSVIYFQDFIPS